MIALITLLHHHIPDHTASPSYPWLPWSHCFTIMSLITIFVHCNNILITKPAHRSIPYHTDRCHSCSCPGRDTCRHISLQRRCHRWPSSAAHLQDLPPGASETLWNCTQRVVDRCAFGNIGTFTCQFEGSLACGTAWGNAGKYRFTDTTIWCG